MGFCSWFGSPSLRSMDVMVDWRYQSFSCRCGRSSISVRERPLGRLCYTSLEARGLRERLGGTQPQHAIHRDFWMSGFRKA